MVRDTKQANVIHQPRGGKGMMKLHPIMTPEELEGCTTLLAKVMLEPSSEIGYHQHVGETEAYYVLSGEGYFLDSDGSKKEVVAGDICTIEEGQSHGMINSSHQLPMEIIAIVIKK